MYLLMSEPCLIHGYSNRGTRYENIIQVKVWTEPNLIWFRFCSWTLFERFWTSTCTAGDWKLVWGWTTNSGDGDVKVGISRSPTWTRAKLNICSLKNGSSHGQPWPAMRPMAAWTPTLVDELSSSSILVQQWVKNGPPDLNSLHVYTIVQTFEHYKTPELLSHRLSSKAF